MELLSGPTPGPRAFQSEGVAPGWGPAVVLRLVKFPGLSFRRRSLDPWDAGTGPWAELRWGPGGWPCRVAQRLCPECPTTEDPGLSAPHTFALSGVAAREQRAFAFLMSWKPSVCGREACRDLLRLACRFHRGLKAHGVRVVFLSSSF